MAKTEPADESLRDTVHLVITVSEEERKNGERTSLNMLGSSCIISTAFWLSDLYNISLIHLSREQKPVR